MIYFWVVVRSYRVQLLEEKINQVVPWATTPAKSHSALEEEEIVWKTVENFKKIYSVYAIKYLSKNTVYSYKFNLIWKEKIN